MSDKKYKDAITYSQSLMKEITDVETIKLFKDENLMHVLKSLRNSPGVLTVKELRDDLKKSDKTIYRYLKKLEDAGLVVQAGKRVFPADKKKVKTQTLYMRTAKIFFPIIKPEDKEKCSEEEQHQKDKMIEAIGLMMSKQINAKLKSVDCLKNFLTQLYSEQSDLPRTIMKNTNDEISELITDLDWNYIESMVETVNLISILYNDELQKALFSCFE